MLETDRDALVCDLAETYGIFDYRALPVPTLATLASGLRDTSRIKMRLSGYKATRSDMLLAAAVDRLSLIHWALTGSDSGKPPKSILDALLDLEETGGDIEAFATAESFEDAWEAATGVRHG